ncbi:MAG: glycosyltransferase family 4 protein [Vicinamibacterales bacterium]
MVCTETSASGQRPIKLLVVGPSLRQWLGGQEVQADLLVRSWCDDPEVRVAFVPHNPAPPRALRWTERLPALRTVVRVPTRLLALWRAVRQSHIVHIFSASHSSFLVATLPAWCVARLLGRRTLIHYHSGRGHEHLQRSRLARLVLRRSDAVVVPSGYLGEIFAAYAIPTEVVANAIDVAELRHRPRRVIRPRLVCTRNFESTYAVDLVVRAFAEIKKDMPSARLLLAGRGSQEAAIRALVRDLDLGDVEFCGAVSRRGIGEVLDGADVFVNASRVDNMPVSILEAFAAGLPVVSAASGGISYLVEHERTGLLSEVGDVSALARNVRRVIADQALAHRLAWNAHDESSRYEWPAIRAAWLRLYRALDALVDRHDAAGADAIANELRSDGVTSTRSSGSATLSQSAAATTGFAFHHWRTSLSCPKPPVWLPEESHDDDH